MNDATQNQHPTQPITCDLPDTTVALNKAAVVVARPDGLTDELWDNIATRLADTADELMESARPHTMPVPCTERSWCTVTSPQEHAEQHARDVVPLTDYDPDTDHGWSCSIVEARGGRPHISFTGSFRDRDFLHEFDVDAMRVLSLLWATSTPDALAALRGVLDEVAMSGQES